MLIGYSLKSTSCDTALPTDEQAEGHFHIILYSKIFVQLNIYSTNEPRATEVIWGLDLSELLVSFLL